MARPSGPERAEGERLLADGVHPTTVAGRLGVSERTVRRWRKEMGSRPKAKPSPPRPRAPEPRPAGLRVVTGNDEGLRPEQPEVIPANAEEMVEALAGQGWSTAKVRQLGRTLGMEVRELEQMRDGLVRRTADKLRRDPAELAAELLLELNHTVALATKAGDLTARGRATASKIRLLGLDRVSVDLRSSNQPDPSVTPDEIRDRRQALLRRLDHLRASDDDE